MGLRSMSAFPPKADISWVLYDVRYVPKADIDRQSKQVIGYKSAKSRHSQLHNRKAAAMAAFRMRRAAPRRTRAAGSGDRHCVKDSILRIALAQSRRLPCKFPTSKEPRNCNSIDC